MNWMPMVAVVVAWLIALIVVIAFRGKHLSRRFCILVLLCSSLGAGAVQYFVFTGIRKTERLSAAHLVEVSCLRIKDDAEFVRKYLIARLAEGKGDRGNGVQIDWLGTFQMKAADISTTFAAVERNAFIRNNYSVWMGNIEFNRGQLDRVAERVVTADEGTPRQTSVNSYLESLQHAVDQLDRLADEMRSRPPEAYFE